MNKSTQILSVLGALLSALFVSFFATSTASAGGLFIPGTGPQAQGRAGAFVAKADDPSALFHNPAGFAKMDGWVVQVGVNFVDYDITFTRDGVYESPSGANLPYEGQRYQPVSDESKPTLGVGSFQAVPLISVSGEVGVKNLRIGFGIYAPQAYPEREFASDYQFEDPNQPPPPQRYDIMKQSAAMVLPTVAVAYRVLDKLDLGARFSAGFGEAKAESYVWGIRNYEEWVSRDGRFTVDVKDKFIPVFGVGGLYRVSDKLEIGGAWSSAISFDGKGTGTAELGTDLGIGGQQEFIEPENDFPLCEQGGTAGALKACVAFKLPQTASIGARWILRDAQNKEQGDLEFDIKWENWKNASDVNVIVDGKSGLVAGKPLNPSILTHGYKDVISLRLGGAYQVPVAGKKIGLRAGIAYDTAAAPDSYQRVDQDGASRVTVGVGFSYWLGKVRVDLGGGFVAQPTRVAPSCNPIVLPGMNERGCPPGSGDIAQSERNAPDPAQPLVGTLNQTQSPFNGGTYESSYLLFTLGLTYEI